MALTSHPGADRRERCGVCGQVGCTQVPPTEFWFPDNLPKDEDVARHRAQDAEEREVVLEEPVSGAPVRPDADSYTGRPRRGRARTGARRRWPSEDRAIHGPREDR